MSRDDLLTRLADLDARDRAWLLGELPPALRRELVDELASEQPAAVGAAESAAAQATGWEALDPQHIAALLDTEPVWLVSAATRGAESSWRERVLQTMSTRRRHEIELADRAGRPLNVRARELVLNACRERLASGGSRASTIPRSGFAALVEHMKSRFA